MFSSLHAGQPQEWHSVATSQSSINPKKFRTFSKRYPFKKISKSSRKLMPSMSITSGKWFDTSKEGDADLTICMCHAVQIRKDRDCNAPVKYLLLGLVNISVNL